MSQYDMTISYIPGEDNSVVDTLSQVSEGAFPGESIEGSVSYFSHLTNFAPGVHATLSIAVYPSVLETI